MKPVLAEIFESKQCRLYGRKNIIKFLASPERRLHPNSCLKYAVQSERLKMNTWRAFLNIIHNVGVFEGVVILIWTSWTCYPLPHIWNDKVPVCVCVAGAPWGVSCSERLVKKKGYPSFSEKSTRPLPTLSPVFLLLQITVIRAWLTSMHLHWLQPPIIKTPLMGEEGSATTSRVTSTAEGAEQY